MLRALKVSYSDDVGEGGVAVNCEKNTIFPEHPVCNNAIVERILDLLKILLIDENVKSNILGI